mgnify:CR=1 FL=1
MAGLALADARGDASENVRVVTVYEGSLRSTAPAISDVSSLTLLPPLHALALLPILRQVSPSLGWQRAERSALTPMALLDDLGDLFDVRTRRLSK